MDCVCLYVCVCVSIYISLTPATMYTFYGVLGHLPCFKVSNEKRNQNALSRFYVKRKIKAKKKNYSGEKYRHTHTHTHI